MNAKAALSKFGPKLVGMTVLTMPIGEWPGGRCIITKIEPDPEAPEIVFEVRGLDGQTHGEEKDDTIGVFGWEEIGL